MKLWSKEALVLGGIYGVLSTPFIYSNNQYIENIGTGLFLLFVICAIMLCFNKTPKFIARTINNFPKLSYYLAAIGWIPYFAIIIPLFLLIVASFVNCSDDTISFCVNTIEYILEFGVPISLIVAFISKKHKK